MIKLRQWLYCQKPAAYFTPDKLYYVPDIFIAIDNNNAPGNFSAIDNNNAPRNFSAIDNNNAPGNFSAIDNNNALGNITESNISADNIIISPPVWLENEDEVLRRLTKLRESGFTRGLAHTLGHIGLLQSAGFRNIHGGFRLNVTNSEAASVYRELGLCDIILSPEMNFRRIAALKPKLPESFPIGIISAGRMPLMTLCRETDFFKTANDRYRTEMNGAVTDRFGTEFPAVRFPGYTEILNSVPLNVTVPEYIDFSVEIICDSPDSPGKFTRGLYNKH